MDTVTKNMLRGYAYTEYRNSGELLNLSELLDSCPALWNEYSLVEVKEFLLAHCGDCFTSVGSKVIPPLSIEGLITIPEETENIAVSAIPIGHKLLTVKGVRYLYRVERYWDKAACKRIKKYKYLGKHIHGGAYIGKKYTHKGYNNTGVSPTDLLIWNII